MGDSLLSQAMKVLMMGYMYPSKKLKSLKDKQIETPEIIEAKKKFNKEQQEFNTEFKL